MPVFYIFKKIRLKSAFFCIAINWMLILHKLVDLALHKDAQDALETWAPKISGCHHHPSASTGPCSAHPSPSSPALFCPLLSPLFQGTKRNFVFPDKIPLGDTAYQ